MRTASHSNLSPFAKCSSFSSSMLMTLESMTRMGPFLRTGWRVMISTHQAPASHFIMG